LDLETVEMLVRSAMHQAGACALTELLRLAVPDQRVIPCASGQQARYRELRSRRVLTAVGTVTVSRPYYLCSHRVLPQVCGACKPWWGQEASFDHGREQLQRLAGLDVTTKSVERAA